MNRFLTGFKVKEVIEDTCLFLGHDWEKEVIKRFVIEIQKTKQVVEASYYLHLNNKGEYINVGF